MTHIVLSHVLCGIFKVKVRAYGPEHETDLMVRARLRARIHVSRRLGLPITNEIRLFLLVTKNQRRDSPNSDRIDTSKTSSTHYSVRSILPHKTALR